MRKMRREEGGERRTESALKNQNPNRMKWGKTSSGLFIRLSAQMDSEVKHTGAFMLGNVKRRFATAQLISKRVAAFCFLARPGRPQRKN